MFTFHRGCAVNPVQEWKTRVAEGVDGRVLGGDHKCRAGGPNVREKCFWEGP